MSVKESELIDLPGRCFLVGLVDAKLSYTAFFSESISAFYFSNLLLMGVVFASCADVGSEILLSNAVFK